MFVASFIRSRGRGSQYTWPTMATGSNTGLGEDDLGDLYEALYPIRKKYKSFGLQIKIKKSEIESIEAQYSDHGDRLLEILTVRTKQTPALTWNLIDKALRSQSVGEHQVADSIRECYGRSDSVGPGLEHRITATATSVGATQQHKQAKTVERESDNSASGSDAENIWTPEPKRKTIPTITYSTESTETQASARKSRKTSGKRSAFQYTQSKGGKTQQGAITKVSDSQKFGRKKRKLQRKYPQTPKNVKLEQYSTASGEYPLSIQSETEINTEKSHATVAKKSNSDISEMEEEQHDTSMIKRGGKKRVCRTASPPTSQGGTRSDLKSKTRATKYQRHLKRVKRQRKIKQESSSSSEIDDDSSSQECDNMLRNFTESENKGLIKAFNCCFGKLCLAIKDPDKAAAELQARHLLSCSMMENLLTSPESQQVKAITLVRALKKRIKSRPARVFTIIEVFLRNEVLEQAGRELRNETGT